MIPVVNQQPDPQLDHHKSLEQFAWGFFFGTDTGESIHSTYASASSPTQFPTTLSVPHPDPACFFNLAQAMDAGGKDIAIQVGFPQPVNR